MYWSAGSARRSSAQEVFEGSHSGATTGRGDRHAQFQPRLSTTLGRSRTVQQSVAASRRYGPWLRHDPGSGPADPRHAASSASAIPTRCRSCWPLSDSFGEMAYPAIAAAGARCTHPASAWSTFARDAVDRIASTVPTSTRGCRPVDQLVAVGEPAALSRDVIRRRSRAVPVRPSPSRALANAIVGRRRRGPDRRRRHARRYRRDELFDRILATVAVATGPSSGQRTTMPPNGSRFVQALIDRCNNIVVSSFAARRSMASASLPAR